MNISYAKQKELPAKNFISTAYDFEFPLNNSRFVKQKLLPYKKSIKELLKSNVVCFDLKAVKKSVNEVKTPEEKIYTIMTHPSVLSGNVDVLTDTKLELIARIKKRIKVKKQITFTMLQFPFKIPNPLKTDRVLPDLGEVIYLYQLDSVAKLIKEVYPQGAKFVILDESLIFRDIGDISLGEALAYRQASRDWISQLGFSKTIELIELREIESKVKEFKDILINNESYLLNGYYKGESKAMKLIEAVLPTLQFSINVKDIPIKNLMNIYNKSLNDSVLSVYDREVRNEIMRDALSNAIRYVAYHSTVKDSLLRDKLWPGSIGVSPIAKPGKFGLFPLNNQNKLYPIHGVPVIRKDGYVIVRYKIDVLRDKNVRYAYTLQDNSQGLKGNAPFFYSEEKLSS